MKWNKLRLVGASNVDLPVLGVDPSGPFILKGVDGLDPPNRDVGYAKMVAEGSVRQAKRAQERQVVALVGLQPDWDTGQRAEELREDMYGLLTPHFDQQVKVQIMMDNTVLAEAKGDVSNIDASIFVKDPEVQVTIDCDHAYLFAPAATVLLPTRTVSGANTLLDISNPGTAPSGFSLSFTLQQAVNTLVLAENDPLGRQMTLNGAFVAGDTIIFDTRFGQRKISRIAAGTNTEKSILNMLDGNSPWLTLHNGNNQLRLNVNTFDWYGNGFLFTPAWWGV